MTRSHYTVNEIFASPQGEGIRAGTMNIFVRFTACNLACTVAPGPLSPGGFDCDTEFAGGRPMTGPEILAFAQELAPRIKAVIFTGGEPGLQVDIPLVALFREAGYFTAIETNGTIDVAGLGLDWITCSPKVAEHAIKLSHCNEIKYVRGFGQALPRPRLKAEHQLLSPAFEGNELQARTIDWILGLLKANPDWRMTVQMHKLWVVR